MPRGITPRRPSRSGRHERRPPAAPVRARVLTEKPRARAAEPDRAAPKQRAQAATSPERIAEILLGKYEETDPEQLAREVDLPATRDDALVPHQKERSNDTLAV